MTFALIENTLRGVNYWGGTVYSQLRLPISPDSGHHSEDYFGRLLVSDKAEIQVQDQFGSWQHYQTVANTPSSIKLALQMALRSPIGRKSKKARAIDPKTKTLIDMQCG